MSVRGFLIGVVLALVLTSETVTLVTQCDKRQAGLPTVARWRVQFGVAVILAGAAGLAWSLGFLTITIDVGTIWRALDIDVAGRVLSQVQTIAMSAVLLTMALVLWWWAEAARE